MDGALYAYNLDGMEIYDFTLYDNLEIPVWNEGGECGGCGDPEGYGAPLEAAGEEPGLIGQWLSTELKISPDRILHTECILEIINILNSSMVKWDMI